jgi:hypothetical protein
MFLRSGLRKRRHRPPPPLLQMVFNVRIVSIPESYLSMDYYLAFIPLTGSRQRPFLARRRPGTGANRHPMQR